MRKILAMLLIGLVTISLSYTATIAGPFFGGAGVVFDNNFSNGNFEGGINPVLEGSFSYLLGKNILFDLVQERLQDGNPDLTRLTAAWVFDTPKISQRFYLGGGLINKWMDVTDTKLGVCAVGGVLWPSDANTTIRFGGKIGYFGNNVLENQEMIFGTEIGYVLTW